MATINRDARWLRYLPIVGRILTGLAPLMLGVGIVGAVHEWRFVQTAHRTEGTIVEMVEHRGDHGVTYSPVYTFRTQTGQEQKVYARTSSYPPAFQVGDKVTVLYRPSSPRDAQLQRFFDMWGWKVLCGGIGVFYGILGPILLVVARKQSKPEDR